ncbi:MAG: NAD(P)/FAD-dependent oxidoreductase [Thaumarchaeota archaeon]|jgi:thioredoxin reductase (NADPH)|nr:NAD(P)/FAD-dependent oxidoreductase [Candidatus Terraquivivens yellowstonensis]MCL7394829.1 NAD(P)/FAD-dependent oxidoreductase [Candidatus Terraquivivens yellowstonensis]MCL7397711.1 NAD(P)/FAD-dependent oxidoreductase [Candidatus Terraquivivens yellowstonensis]MCL7398995.1 NAD(P)/FAD-dependent oxidoreductase [Candidatus Terraquivivens yellowstonensis]MCL7400505.1 NAD(P)/FAD-dependent oxidoreductase [Candidatus Terraquivivens yellowstonensis]
MSLRDVDEEVYDITIVGGGPVGLFATFYSGIRNMKTKLIEALPHLGGQLSTLYPDKYIRDVPGYTKILARDFVKKLEEQAMQFNPTIRLNEKVIALRRLDEKLIELETTRGLHYSKTVLLATGMGAISMKKLGIPSVDRFEGRGVFYAVTDKWAFKGKKVMIVGGGDSAVDWALNLKDVASEVMLVHRRAGFRAQEAKISELFHSNIRVFIPYVVKDAHGTERLEVVTLTNIETGEEITLEIDSLIPQIGYEMNNSFYKSWGLDVDERGIKVNEKMETSVPGIFAAGDVASPINSIKLNLITIGLAQAIIAVNCAKNYIEPSAPMFPGYTANLRL